MFGGVDPGLEAVNMLTNLVTPFSSVKGNRVDCLTSTCFGVKSNYSDG